MLHESTKEAIKVGIAVSLAILTALWLGWDKAYWSAITVFIVAANESYSHALRKGYNRLIGTVLGAFCAILLLGTFAQNEFLFIVSLEILLAISVFMSSHKRVGYSFTIGFAICAIISAISGLDSANIFNLAVLRFQETMLGVVVYTIVFRFIWPRKTEDLFFSSLEVIVAQLRNRIMLELYSRKNEELTKIDKHIDDPDTLKNRLIKLQDVLSLPLNGSLRLRHEKEAWQLVLRAIAQLDYLLDQYDQEGNISISAITEGEKLLVRTIVSPKSHHPKLEEWLTKMTLIAPIPEQPSSAFSVPIKQRFVKVAKALCIHLTCLALWIYLPLPGGYIMPMIGSIYANMLVTLPDSAIKNAIFGVLIWGTLFLAEYVFILPLFTEAWQLAAFYFFNCVLIWKVCSIPLFSFHKILAGNLLVIFTMGALQYTPSYGIETSLTMFTFLMLTLGIAGFYTKLFQVNS